MSLGSTSSSRPQHLFEAGAASGSAVSSCSRSPPRARRAPRAPRSPPRTGRALLSTSRTQVARFDPFAELQRNAKRGRAALPARILIIILPPGCPAASERADWLLIQSCLVSRVSVAKGRPERWHDRDPLAEGAVQNVASPGFSPRYALLPPRHFGSAPARAARARSLSTTRSRSTASRAAQRPPLPGEEISRPRRADQAQSPSVPTESAQPSHGRGGAGNNCWFRPTGEVRDDEGEVTGVQQERAVEILPRMKAS
jgi:hypothetical protein